jgi:hypothetical protein
MGLLDISSVGFPGFGSMIIQETFHWPGNYPVLNILLKMRVIAFVPTSGKF